MEIFLFFFGSLLVFLFPLYVLAKDDYVISKKNISIEKVFDFSLIAVMLTIIFGRFFYVFFNFNPKFLNPFYFLLLPYFPGLFLPGGFLGVLLFFILYEKRSKMPVYRIFDFIAVSLLWTMLFIFFAQNISLFFVKKPNFFPLIAQSLIYLILAVIFTRLFQKIKIGEGSIGFLIFGFLSLAFLLSKIFLRWNHPPIYSGEDFVTLSLLFISFALFLKKEGILEKIKLFKKKNKAL